MALFAAAVLLAHSFHQPGPFIRAKPGRLLRSIRQPAPNQEAKHYRGQSFNQEEPLPAPKPRDAVHEFHDGSGKWMAKGAGQRRSGKEQCHGSTAFTSREPEGQVKNHAGKEARFRDAEQETESGKAQRTTDKHHGAGDQSPAHHDPGNPAPSADTTQYQIAGHFEADVAEIKNASGRYAIDEI